MNNYIFCQPKLRKIRDSHIDCCPINNISTIKKELNDYCLAEKEIINHEWSIYYKNSHEGFIDEIIEYDFEKDRKHLKISKEDDEELTKKRKTKEQAFKKLAVKMSLHALKCDCDRDNNEEENVHFRIRKFKFICLWCYKNIWDRESDKQELIKIVNSRDIDEIKQALIDFEPKVIEAAEEELGVDLSLYKQ